MTRDQSLLPTACVGRRDIAWVIALIPRTRTDIRKYLCREKKKEGRKKKKKGKGKKVETEKPHPTHDIESRRRNPAQSSAIFRPFRPLLRNLGFSSLLPWISLLSGFERKEIRGYSRFLRRERKEEVRDFPRPEEISVSRRRYLEEIWRKRRGGGRGWFRSADESRGTAIHLLRNNGRNNNEVRSLVTIMLAALLYTGMVKSREGAEEQQRGFARAANAAASL